MEPYIPGLSGSSRFSVEYPGDRAASAMADRRLVGPGRGRDFYFPVSAAYDPVTDRTRVQFQPVPRDLFAPRSDGGQPPLRTSKPKSKKKQKKGRRKK